MNTATLQSITIPSDIQSINNVKSFIKAVCEEYNLQPSIYRKISICLSEAVTNAIIHGNQSNQTKKVLITFSIQGSAQFKFFVKDEGNGFNLNNIPNPTDPQNLLTESGRGVYLIHALASTVQYHNNGSLVEINFNITPNEH